MGSPKSNIAFRVDYIIKGNETIIPVDNFINLFRIFYSEVLMMV